MVESSNHFHRDLHIRCANCARYTLGTSEEVDIWAMRTCVCRGRRAKEPNCTLCVTGHWRFSITIDLIATPTLYTCYDQD